MTAPPLPPPGPAIEHGPTREALGVHARRPWWFLGAAVASFAVSGGLGAAGAADSVWLFPLAVAVAGVTLAVWFGLRWRWMRAVLRASPWVPRRGRHFVTGWGDSRQATILVEADEHGPEVMGGVPEGRAIARDITPVDGPLDLWLAGDPDRGAVVTVDGTTIAPFTQSRWGWWRRHLRARIATRESGERPDLYRPSGPARRS